MIKHVWILLWNQRRKSVSILLEQSLVFIILMICVTSSLTTLKKYNAPGLLHTKNVIYFGYMLHTSYTYGDMDQVGAVMDVVIDHLKKFPYVEGISESVQFMPYLRPNENFWEDSVKISSEKKILAKTKGTDAAAYKVFKLDLVAGRWFEDGERPHGFYPAVVTAQFATQAEMHNPIGKIVQVQSQVYEIVGVIAGIKESVFAESPVAIIVPIPSWNRIGFYREYAARIKPGHEEDFYSGYYAELQRLSVNFGLFEPIISEMDKWKNETMLNTITEKAFIVIPTLFLFLFALIGTTGLLLLDIKTRTSEFALRIALGSTRKKLVKTVLIQNVILSLIAAMPSLILALFIYELNAVNLIAVASTLVLVILFSVISAWYPAWKISQVNPAEALQYE